MASTLTQVIQSPACLATSIIIVLQVHHILLNAQLEPKEQEILERKIDLKDAQSAMLLRSVKDMVPLVQSLTMK